MRHRAKHRGAIETNSPPWRQPLGLAFLRLDTPDPTSLEIDEVHELKYIALLRKTFSAFSDVPIGSDVPVEDLNAPRRIGFDPEWEVDVVPMRGMGEGNQDILYDTISAETPVKSTLRQPCWNCLEPGHSFTSCPRPRDHQMVRYSRAKFMAEKEAMPDHARVYLESYTFTEAERIRRLELAERFVPGTISEALADAVFWIDPDVVRSDHGEMEDGELPEESEEILEIQGFRRRRAWPWLIGMSRWGYPPGWIASGDPIEAVKRHIEHLPISTEDESDNEEDMLKIFGDLEDSPIDSLDSSSEAGSSMVLSNDSSPELSRLSIQGLANGAAPEPLSLPPPPPPPTDGIAPPIESPPPLPRQIFPAPRRWANYDTDMFDSERLTAYTSARPLPLGS